MMKPASSFRAVLFAISTSGLHAAELGDTNGDGRVSFADARSFALWSVTGDEAFRPAPGSADFEPVFGCTADPTGSLIPELLFLEALRRSSVAPFPHFIERWPEGGGDGAPPPPPDRGSGSRSSTRPFRKEPRRSQSR
jgi:hypothetical protein